MSEWDFYENNFYKNKKVLVTGQTGFKGTWLCRILLKFFAGNISSCLTNENLLLKNQRTVDILEAEKAAPLGAADVG